MARTCSIDARPGLLGRTVSAQAARPHGLLGRSLGHLWVHETAAVNDRAIALLDPHTGEHVLEIGCGPGRAAAEIADRGARVTGVDPSEVMVAQALRRNRAAVNAGRVRVLLGESGTLPVDGQSFDAVLAIHTIYFWRDLVGGLREAHDALRPGGRIVIGYRPAERGRPRRLDPAVYRIPTSTQLDVALGSAGFTDTTTHDDGHISIAVATVLRRYGSSQLG